MKKHNGDRKGIQLKITCNRRLLEAKIRMMKYLFNYDHINKNLKYFDSSYLGN